MNLEKIYKDAGAYLEGHFLLSSGNHSQFYLQSAKVLEDPALAGKLADELAAVIEKFGKNLNTYPLKPLFLKFNKPRACIILSTYKKDTHASL